MTIQIICGDSIYDIDNAYKEGALSCRNGGGWHWSCNYHEDSYEADQWKNGYMNEEAEEHFRFGIDIIAYNGPDRIFEEDPDVPRDKNGNVDWSEYKDLVSMLENDYIF